MAFLNQKPNFFYSFSNFIAGQITREATTEVVLDLIAATTLDLITVTTLDLMAMTTLAGRKASLD
ncbi:MAG: hypothetical protein LBI10_02365 [Deltaproteobacteria bacterium]|nr:hypothetical protein [Deltaproteobacteria bacterium]